MTATFALRDFTRGEASTTNWRANFGYAIAAKIGRFFD